MISLKKIGSIFNFSLLLNIVGKKMDRIFTPIISIITHLSLLFRNGKKAPHLIRADSGIGKLYYKGTNNFEDLSNYVILNNYSI